MTVDSSTDRAKYLTPWFPKNITPVRVGVYEVREKAFNNGRSLYAYWNGQWFGWRSREPKDAYYDRKLWTYRPRFVEWRGLTNPNSYTTKRKLP